jgi:SET domain-containing protein
VFCLKLNFSYDYNSVLSRTHQRAPAGTHTRTHTIQHTKFSVLKKSVPVPATRRTQVRESGIHGKGVFAMRDFAEGETIMEYTGEVISWQEAQDRHPHDPSNPNHTFYFHIDDTRVIDGLRKGNSAKWINHSCDGNCEADEVRGRIFIKALRNIKAGEELHYDYGLVTDERYTAKLKAEYPCWCGAKTCRGTLLAPKRPQWRKG